VRSASLLPSLAPVGTAESAPAKRRTLRAETLCLPSEGEQFLTPHVRQRSSWSISRRTTEVKRLARMIEAAAMDVTGGLAST
jgi:hypothetical protein